MRLPLRLQFLICIAVIVAMSSGITLFFSSLSISQSVFVWCVVVGLSLVVGNYLTRNLRQGIEAIELGLLNIKDGEYSTTIAHNHYDELDALCELLNQTSQQLREDKHWLFQRELLLDKITQSSPESLFLVNDHGQIVFSNIAARRFFGVTYSLEGKHLNQLVDENLASAAEHIFKAKEGLFTLVDSDKESQTWYLTTGKFTLNNQPHVLYILKQMTRELSRQEVAVWKKVIRVISHELNNSLGPISSMLHSGKLLTEGDSDQRLQRVFATIEDRISHLVDFVQGYGKFAKLPLPEPERVDLLPVLESLSEQWIFSCYVKPKTFVYIDPIQLEQLLINLLKNAHESLSKPEDIQVSAFEYQGQSVIEVADAGVGMSDTVLNQALVPFYSTKASGSGLGLALCREIIDAHQGTISLQNRAEGGIKVTVTLPGQEQTQ